MCLPVSQFRFPTFLHAAGKQTFVPISFLGTTAWPENLFAANFAVAHHFG
jgi:hypothetical protein